MLTRNGEKRKASLLMSCEQPRWSELSHIGSMPPPLHRHPIDTSALVVTARCDEERQLPVASACFLNTSGTAGNILIIPAGQHTAWLNHGSVSGNEWLLLFRKQPFLSPPYPRAGSQERCAIVLEAREDIVDDGSSVCLGCSLCWARMSRESARRANQEERLWIHQEKIRLCVFVQKPLTARQRQSQRPKRHLGSNAGFMRALVSTEHWKEESRVHCFGTSSPRKVLEMDSLKKWNKDTHTPHVFCGENQFCSEQHFN